MSMDRGVAGVTRKVTAMERGVAGVARKIRSAERGVSGVARRFFGSAVYFSQVHTNPSPYDDSNTYSVIYQEGGFVLTQTAATAELTNDERTKVNLYMRGLKVGDTVSFDFNYDGPGASWTNAFIADLNYNTFYMQTTGDDSGHVSHTITEDDGGGFRFWIEIGTPEKYTQTLTVTNLTVNGEVITPT